MIIIRNKYFSEKDNKQRPTDGKDLALVGTGLGGSAASLVTVNKWGKNYLDAGTNELNVRYSRDFRNLAKQQGLSEKDASQRLRGVINKMSHGSKEQLKAAEEAAAKKGSKVAQSLIAAAKSEKLARKNAKLTAIGAGLGLGSMAAIKYRDHKWKKNQDNK